jgi:hypothetical protein
MLRRLLRSGGCFGDTATGAARVRRPWPSTTDTNSAAAKKWFATGHISFEQPLDVGERVTMGSSHGIMQSVAPTLQDRELQLIVQLLPGDAETDETTIPPRQRRRSGFGRFKTGRPGTFQSGKTD